MLMQIKTINKIISKKMNEWLDTISDESLREKVKESLLVSGGCITSMLLKIPVNDYDVYIQDMNVLKELAEYYLMVEKKKNYFIMLLCIVRMMKKIIYLNKW
jgi:hypothetical protein